MYDNHGNPPGGPGGPRPPLNTPQTPFGNPFYGASSGLIRGGLGAYGEKILGSSSEYVQSNVSNNCFCCFIIFRFHIVTPRYILCSLIRVKFRKRDHHNGFQSN